MTQLKVNMKKLVLKTLLLKRHLLFKKHNIDKRREEDIRIYFKGKELSFSEETLAEELVSHPEWCKKKSRRSKRLVLKKTKAKKKMMKNALKKLMVSNTQLQKGENVK